MSLHDVARNVNAESRTISSDVPPDVLQMRAAEQRQRLHATLSELRSGVRQKLDVRSQLREYVWPASAAAALISLIFGYTSGHVLRRGLH